MTDLADVQRIYNGSDAQATIGLYAELEALGQAGSIAVNLLRAAKKSGAAKRYRGSRYKRASYGGKGWALEQAVTFLSERPLEPPIAWGWGIDTKLKQGGDPHYYVLYVDLPTGQVSFHTDVLLGGPTYAGQWDGARGASPERICRWAAMLLGDESVLQNQPQNITENITAPVDAPAEDLFSFLDRM